MSASSYTEWLPGKAKVNCESHMWQIEKLDSQTFQKVKSRNGYDLYCLVSPVCMMSMVKNGELQKLCLHLSLALWQRGSSVFVSLTLSEFNRSQSDGSNETAEISDSRNICIAWIAGKKEYRSALSGRMCNGLCYFVSEEFVLYDDLFDKSKGLLRDGQLAIVCEVLATTGDVALINGLLFDPLKSVLSEYKGTLADDLQKLREEGKNTDFTVVARDGRAFPVHTLILSSRSAYFATMLKRDIREKHENRVVIDGISPEAVAGLLDFIYTDAVPNINSMAPELLSAAHRYNIPSLMLLCEDPLKPVLSENRGNTLAGDLQKLREEGKNTDFTVVARDGREFPVHTLILSSRSAYFATMLKQDIREKHKNRVVIDDISPEAVAGLIDFIYTDAVPNINSVAPELLSAAHRYNIPSLMLLCEETMVSNMNVDNAAQLYQLAYHYDANHFLSAAKQFIIRNMKHVRATDGWKQFVYDNAHLVGELLKDMAEIMAELTSP